MKKISKNKIATTYAEALYQAAAENKSEAKVFDDAVKLNSVLAQDTEMVKFMANPMLANQDKQDVLQEIAHKLQWNKDTLRCLEVIAENRRFSELPLILQEYCHVYYKHKGINEVEVSTVKALNKTQDEKLRQKLAKLLQSEVVVTYKIVPELIGGLRIKFGSEMIDNSLVSKLNRLENIMKGVQ